MLVMPDKTQKLIVVYKDELALNLLKKLLETNDGAENGIGSVTVIAWDEKMWLQQKKAGNVQAKILFIGHIKGSDKLLPVIDVKYEKWGIKYGWAGKQAIIVADEGAVSKKEEYQKFQEEFKVLSLPAKEKDKMPMEIAKIAGIAALLRVAGLLAPIGLGAAFAVDFFKNRPKVRQQLYLYGIVEFYKNHLESFMKA